MDDLTQQWGDAVAAWCEYLASAGRAASTIRTRREHVQALSRWSRRRPWEVTEGDLLAWTGSRSWARETRRAVRASMRSFYGWGVLTGRVNASPALVLPAVTPGLPRPRPAPERAYRAALGATDERGRLILRLAAEVGLRRAEVAVIHGRDLVDDLLGVSLIVHGKGSRDRVVPLPTPLALQLRARVEQTGGWAFPGDVDGHLSPRWVGTVAARALPEGWTLHTLRHRFATAAYSAERDLIAVQTLLGHSSPVTTRRYIALDPDRLRRTVAAAGR